MAQRLDADDGFHRATRGKRVTENSFRAGERWHAIVKNRFQRDRFRDVIVARARAVRVDVINR